MRTSRFFDVFFSFRHCSVCIITFFFFLMNQHYVLLKYVGAATEWQPQKLVSIIFTNQNNK